MYLPEAAEKAEMLKGNEDEIAEKLYLYPSGSGIVVRGGII